MNAGIESELRKIIHYVCENGPFYHVTASYSTCDPAVYKGVMIKLPLCIFGPMKILRKYLEEDISTKKKTFIDQIDEANLELNKRLIEDIKWIALECNDYEIMEVYLCATPSIYIFTLLYNILKLAMHKPIELSPFFCLYNLQINFFMNGDKTLLNEEQEDRISHFRLFEKTLRFFYRTEMKGRVDVHLFIFNYVMHELLLIIRDYIKERYHTEGSLDESRYIFDVNNRHPEEINRLFTTISSSLATIMMKLPENLIETEEEEKKQKEREEHGNDSKSMESVNRIVRKYEHCFKNILFINDIDLFNLTKRPIIPQVVLWDPRFNYYVEKMKQLEDLWEQTEALLIFFQ